MNKEFGKKIKRLRQEKDMTQGDLAAIIGCTQQMISHLENGICQPNLETMTKLKNFFEIEWNALLPVS